jgi:hypothetical protein
MAFPLYLACTAAEFSNPDSLPAHPAWMACHFSGYSTGLSNLPTFLPAGSMLILNDRTPIAGHNTERIAQQLKDCVNSLQCESVLLDFERPNIPAAEELARVLVGALPCPVGVSASYAVGTGGAVFVPPVPPQVPLEEYLAPWREREVWLEMALCGSMIGLTPEGMTLLPGCGDFPAGPIHCDAALHCHYSIRLQEEAAVFTLRRMPEDLWDRGIAAAPEMDIREIYEQRKPYYAKYADLIIVSREGEDSTAHQVEEVMRIVGIYE